MWRRSVMWIALAVEIPGISLLLSSWLGSGFDSHRTALGISLSILGVTLVFLTRWPKPSQVNPALIVSMVLSILLFRPVVMRARWPDRWRLVAYVACWGTLLLLSLTSIAAALFGDSVTALGLAAVACCLTMLGSLIMTMAASPADNGQG